MTQKYQTSMTSYPAMQVQWAAATPCWSSMAHGTIGVADTLWECLTYNNVNVIMIVLFC